MGKFALGCIAAFVLIALLGGGLVFFGLGKAAEMLEEQIRDHPVIVEHLGTIEEVDVDLIPTTMDENQKGRTAINLTGSKASGVFYARVGGEDKMTILDGDLNLESGEIIPIVFEQPDDQGAAGDGEPAGDAPDAKTPTGENKPEAATPTESATPTGTTPAEKESDAAPKDKKEPAGAPK